jgi:peptidoglycan/LPS O-acetylase OafA/YrhL
MKLESIQTVRAFAVLMVIFYHSHWAAQGKPSDFFQIPLLSDFGYLGVQLFFVVSGFIMAHISSKNNFQVKNFLIRRLWRIIPLYWVVLLLILFISFTTNVFDKEIETLGMSGVIKSFLLFPMQEYPLLSPGWSLEHEALFYIIVALIIPYTNLKVLFITILFLWILGLNYQGWDYHLLSEYHIYFAFGIVSYWLRKKEPIVLGIISAFGLITAYLGLYGIIHINILFKTLSLAIVFSFLISTLVSMEFRGTKFPSFLVRIGDISYSIYLTHALVYIAFDKVGWKIHANPEIWRIFALIVALFVGLITYEYIETRLKKTRK